MKKWKPTQSLTAGKDFLDFVNSFHTFSKNMVCSLSVSPHFIRKYNVFFAKSMLLIHETVFTLNTVLPPSLCWWVHSHVSVCYSTLIIISTLLLEHV